MKIFVMRNNQQLGPYTELEAQAYLALGHLLRTDLARHATGTAWEPISRIVPPVRESAKTFLNRFTRRQKVVGIASAAILAVLLFIGLAVSLRNLDRSNFNGRSGTSDVSLNASVRQSPFGITVTNGGSSTYEDVTVKINYGLTGEFVANRNRISAGETITIPYSEFTDSSSQRFNYATTRPERVMVRAKVGGTYDWEEFTVSR